jgi:hypothetical protein
MLGSSVPKGALSVMSPEYHVLIIRMQQFYFLQAFSLTYSDGGSCFVTNSTPDVHP